MYPEDDLLPISALADLVFCERRAALHHLEAVWEDNLSTMEGTLLHQRVDEQLPTEARGDVRIARGLRLHSLRLGLSGKADVVEFHRVSGTAPAVKPQGAVLTGVSGLWTPFPVEYKRGIMRHERSFEVQLCGQALCIEEMLSTAVPFGVLFYGKSGRRYDVTFDASLRKETELAALRLHELSREGKTPSAVYEKKCDRCSLLSLCLPKSTGGKRSVSKYLAAALAVTKEERA
jgi:CRISPR-associated exonuclease Cas4